MTHQLSSTHGSCTLLTISDSRTEANDASGDLIEQKLLVSGHQLAGRFIVRDEVVDIRAAISAVVIESPPNHFLITTGGSGIGYRDCTPEAFEGFEFTPLTGFGELFRMYSEREIGPRAMLSRANAGILLHRKKRMPFFILPGSTQAVTLAMDACILPTIGHILDLCHSKEQA